MASVQTGHAAAGSMTQRRFGLPDDEPVPMKMISDMRLPSAARRSSAVGLGWISHEQSCLGRYCRAMLPSALSVTTP